MLIDGPCSSPIFRSPSPPSPLGECGYGVRVVNTKKTEKRFPPLHRLADEGYDAFDSDSDGSISLADLRQTSHDLALHISNVVPKPRCL